MQINSPLKPRPPGARKKSVAARMRSVERPPVSHGYFKSFDDTKIFYSIEGRGKPLIFCYGLVCSSLHWTYQIEHFKNTHQAVWFDYRGHHNSDVPKDLDSLTLESSAKDLHALIEELNIKDAVFLGHSMGVNVVLEYYRQHPERVAGMVLANGTAKRPLETLFNHNIFQSGFRMLKKIHDRSPRLVNHLWKLQKANPFARSLVAMGGFNPHLTPKEDIELYVEQVADIDPNIFLRLISNYDDYDATPWLHTIQVPTLIISGANDQITPVEQQELMHQLIPGSRMEVIRHGSHCSQMDLPELVNHKIENFLQEIGYAATPETATAQAATPPQADATIVN